MSVLSKTSSHVSASAKHPIIKQLPEKKHCMTQLNSQQKQKFLLQTFQLEDPKGKKNNLVFCLAGYMLTTGILEKEQMS